MDKKVIYENIYKNRFLIINCVVLIFGTIFGTSMLKIIPEEICENFYGFVSKQSSDLFNVFINRFSFPFIILLFLYFSGTSLLGMFSALAAIFINGFFYGFENSINYKFSGIDYVVNSLVIYFTSAVFMNFMIIVMAENSIFSSKQLHNIIDNKNPEKSHYNAKKSSVKFITFTVFAALISLISSAFLLFIQSVL